jgi:cytochrome d ubiquinol oxidase subunit II
MSHSDVAAGLILVGLSAYLLFGGADFGAGLWHLIAARRPAGGRPVTEGVIEHAMGPLWEANHVWLIFVMVLTWTAFPPVFADIMTTYWVPLSLAALGIVIRGSAFVFFRTERRRRYRWAFGAASLLTPFTLGAVAGTVATGGGRWLSASGAYAGLLTVGLCAYLAAVYLTWDARRLAGTAADGTAGTTGAAGDGRTGSAGPTGSAGDGDAAAERFRRYALGTGIGIGGMALPGAAVLDVGSPLIGLSALAGLVSLALLWRRAYLAVRVSAALAAGSVLWGAADLGHLDLDAAAAQDTVLRLVFVALAVGAIFLLPSLAWLYVLFQREAGSHEDHARAG